MVPAQNDYCHSTMALTQWLLSQYHGPSTEWLLSQGKPKNGVLFPEWITKPTFPLQYLPIIPCSPTWHEFINWCTVHFNCNYHTLSFALGTMFIVVIWRRGESIGALSALINLGDYCWQCAFVQSVHQLWQWRVVVSCECGPYSVMWTPSRELVTMSHFQDSSVWCPTMQPTSRVTAGVGKPVTVAERVRAPTFRSGRSENLKVEGLNPDLMLSNPGRDKPMTEACRSAACAERDTNSHHTYGRERKGGKERGREGEREKGR